MPMSVEQKKKGREQQERSEGVERWITEGLQTEKALAFTPSEMGVTGRFRRNDTI